MQDHERSIPRLVEPPTGLPPEEVRRIHGLVYRAPELRHGLTVDALFVFGTLHRDFSFISDLYWQTGAKFIVATGYKSPKVTMAHGPEAYHALTRLGIPASQVLWEDQAKHTVEDVRNGLELLVRRCPAPKQVLYVSHATHSGRCERSLRKFLPEAHLAAAVYPRVEGYYPSYPATPTGWYDDPDLRQRVYAEFLRIEEYAARGWIAPP